ncbi:oxidoreductase [Paenibacillus montaniterrae]|uniref:Oxidoreductase n=1 Tax=Paenibacillus montaniterrae TaxID=429341 RepID=A0A919YS75_9BACL|nr:oxidoreductase [Paenibacillus montaniterrae]
MTYMNQPFHIKGMELKNRIVMAPMCQYSVEANDGIPTEWHHIHYASRAIGGTGLIIVEMTNVEPRGRITNRCLGLWSDDHIPAFKQIVDSVHRYGSKIGIQIAHAGRKAQDAELPVAPSSISVTHDDTTPKPYALTTEEVEQMVLRYKEAAARAVACGFDCIELHGAHGYLIHQFHSPGINKRDDQYGKDLALFGEQVVQAVRSVMPESMPLLFRISAMEYMQDGYQVEHAIELSKRYLAAGVDCFHVSSGGEGPVSVVKPGNDAGYQVPLAKAFKEAFPDVPIIAVGKLEEAAVAEAVLEAGDADLVAIGRGMLNDPYWALHAIKQLTGTITPPEPYVRGM